MKEPKTATDAGSAPEAFNDQRLEAIIGNLLRIGVLVAAAIVSIGAIIYLARHWAEALPNYRTFRDEPSPYRSLEGIFASVREGSGRGIIQLGLLALIGTPVARVIFSAAAFAAERDWLYVGITLVVFGTLCLSMLGGY